MGQDVSMAACCATTAETEGGNTYFPDVGRPVLSDQPTPHDGWQQDLSSVAPAPEPSPPAATSVATSAGAQQPRMMGASSVRRRPRSTERSPRPMKEQTCDSPRFCSSPRSSREGEWNSASLLREINASAGSLGLALAPVPAPNREFVNMPVSDTSSYGQWNYTSD